MCLTCYDRGLTLCEGGGGERGELHVLAKGKTTSWSSHHSVGKGGEKQENNLWHFESTRDSKTTKEKRRWETPTFWVWVVFQHLGTPKDADDEKETGVYALQGYGKPGKKKIPRNITNRDYPHLRKGGGGIRGGLDLLTRGGWNKGRAPVHTCRSMRRARRWGMERESSLDSLRPCFGTGG